MFSYNKILEDIVQKARTNAIVQIGKVLGISVKQLLKRNNLISPYDKINKIPLSERPSYIGSNLKGKAGSREVRQKYYDLDQEYTDSVKSISKRYGLNPNLVASRIAEEGPIDRAIGIYNTKDNYYKKFWTELNRGTDGPNYGLDHLGTRLKNGEIKLTTTAPYQWSEANFTNNKGQHVKTISSPQWWFGIEGTAAELSKSRKDVIQTFPGKSDDFYDAAAQILYNYGKAGGINYIRKGNSLENYKPYIKLK